MKELLKMLGPGCGTCRQPLRPRAPADVVTLHAKLESIGFFEWCWSGDGKVPYQRALKQKHDGASATL